MSIFGLLIAVFIGIGLISRELERRTIYTVASKPIPRWLFVLGKYLGLLLVLAVELAIMSTVLVVLLAIIGSPLDLDLVWAIWLVYVELALVAAVALVFSTFSSPTMATFFTLSIVVIGRLAGDLRDLALQAESAATRATAEALYVVLPDLQRFNGRVEAVHPQSMELDAVLFATAYGALYAAILVAIAQLVFARRDFR